MPTEFAIATGLAIALTLDLALLHKASAVPKAISATLRDLLLSDSGNQPIVSRQSGVGSCDRLLRLRLSEQTSLTKIAIAAASAANSIANSMRLKSS